jgi:hypothetical protein
MHHVDVGVDRLIVTLQCVFVDICGIVGFKRPENRHYVFYARLVFTLDVQLEPCKSG